MSLEDQLRRQMADFFKIDLSDLSDGAFLIDTIGADPYDLDALALMLGNEFSIKIGQADIDSWDSVGDVIHTFVEKVEE